MAKLTRRSTKLLAAGAITLILAAGAATAAYFQTRTSHAPAPAAVPNAVTVVAVGDINPDGAGNKSALATAKLVDQINPAAVLGLGDYQYENGSCANFTAAGHYDTTWGSENSRLYPTFGPVHDFDNQTSEAARYMAGNCPGQSAPASAGLKASGWSLSWDTPYSFNVGTWHIASLPSLCFDYSDSCDPSKITAWLQQDLDTHTNQCSIAFWHQPYWTSPTAEHTADTQLQPWMQVLYQHNVELLLSGHQHFYERFNRQDPTGKLDAARGIREIVVGTGGMTHYQKLGTAANEAAYDDDTFGVLKLQLGQDKYSWQFLPTTQGGYSDSGSGTCH
jgi:acid phosphatase type 7